MLTTVIIEDEVDSQVLLDQILKEYCPMVENKGIAGCKESALALIRSVKPDLVFLDIQLQDTNAFALLDILKDIDFKIIFTTAFAEYAIKAFRYEAVDYLLKPYTPKDVISAVSRIKDKPIEKNLYPSLSSRLSSINLGQAVEKLSIATTEGIVVYNLDDILRFEADGPYSMVFSKNNKKTFTSRTIKDFEAEISSAVFFRCHKSHLINLREVEMFLKEDGGFAVLTNGERIPVSRRKRQEFIDILTQKS
jgi:two-component system, LytTR family, response regulator